MSITADDIRAKLQVSETDWPTATLQGKLFVIAGAAWLAKCLDDAGLTYDGLTATEQTYADNAEICWVAAEVCRAEARKAARSGSSFKAGPVQTGGIEPGKWAEEAKNLMAEANTWLNRCGATSDSVVSGFATTGGEFGKRDESDYYTEPDRFPMLDDEHQEVD